MSKSTSMCVGCRDHFYNAGQNRLGIKECWSLKTAKKVRRWKLGWWTRPDEPGAFTEVQTYSCHWEPGQYAFYKELPDFAVDPHKEELPTIHIPNCHCRICRRKACDR